MIGLGRILAISFAVAALVGCGPMLSPLAPPSPQEITEQSVGHFCGMSLTEHAGPKGQVFVKGEATPVWFSSAREVFAYTFLEEEPKSLAAIYVTDMGRARNWRAPEPGLWIEARKAFYVIGGRPHAGLGAGEVVPFADRAQADRFAAETGGRVVGFGDMPEDYILGGGVEPQAPADPTIVTE